jgi:hypothetical protein
MTRLTDKNGDVSTGAKGVLIEGNDILALTAGYYIANEVLESGSALPTNIEKGYMFYDDGTGIPATGDSVYPFTFTKLCDVQNGTITTPKGEIDITTLCDDENNYGAGRADVSGSFDGIYDLAITDAVDGIVSQFYDVVRQTKGVNSVEITKVNDNNIYLRITQNDGVDGNNESFVLVPAILTQLDLGIALNSAQTFSTSFRKAQDSDVKMQKVILAPAV